MIRAWQPHTHTHIIHPPTQPLPPPHTQACRFALRVLHEKSLAATAAAAAAATIANKQQSEAETELGLSEEAAAAEPVFKKLVGASEMAGALARISYQSDAAASHVNAIRNLPQQQQMHLLALATAVATAAVQAVAKAEAEEAARDHGLTTEAYRAKYYWGPSNTGPKPTKAANPFAAAGGTPVTGGGVAGVGALPAARTGGGAGAQTPRTPAGMMAGDAAREVPLAAAYEHYRQLSGQMFQQPASEQVRAAVCVCVHVCV